MHPLLVKTDGTAALMRQIGLVVARESLFHSGESPSMQQDTLLLGLSIAHSFLSESLYFPNRNRTALCSNSSEAACPIERGQKEMALRLHGIVLLKHARSTLGSRHQ